MTGYKRVNYYELCRLCTSSQPKDKIHIFREEGRKMQLQQKIQSCFPLLVSDNDYLPKVVCTSCIQTLEQCFTFRQNCINSETMLSSYFANFRFTDDFKKAGKVYVKDTVQKLENTNQLNGNSMKKIVQENMPTNQPQPNLLSEVNQQYFTLELPTIPSKIPPNYTKLPMQNPDNEQKPPPDFNITQNITLKPHEHQQIKYSLKPTINNENQSNLIPCNVTTLNFNNQTNFQPQKNGYEPKILNNIESVNNTEFNMIKSNAIQPMMLVDMEQLIESGLPENEVNKLKDVLLKPPNIKVLEKLDHDHLNNNIKDVSSKCFKCDICDKLFKRREHLYQHTKLHSGLRPFSCMHCPKTYSRKEHLMRHLTSHSGAKDFCCEICNKKFSRPDNLKKHKKSHQKSGPFVCEICQKSFVIKHYYLAHKLQHHGTDSIINDEIHM